MSPDKSWLHHSLPPPPYALFPGCETAPTKAYAVLGGGSHLCVSGEGVGTYCFDTTTREWTRAGDWMLPFYGKAEHVPELGIWFGVADYRHDYAPSASDLSPALRGEEPELCCVGKNHYPPGWELVGDTQIVTLGSGRICTLDFVVTMDNNALDYGGNPAIDDSFAVLRGLELLPRGHGDKQPANNGNGKFRMINHKSMVYRPHGGNWLEAVL
ncbi:hypothetical protein PR202_gb10271 [Eleusine coracana subsp. coracana]|uniref:Uncharacterized protein n=1 Tax=Eleusine coracana subsp. coracana TaxID=191504 RepID=A0AAV5EJQ6_ELECO|nr:hypothetical protein QOZ80_3BG0253610 [Eleusine coracana subsp. coracana]GJN22680.1 hypothetical protein PR202_gb10271 [Eleusine coracana subsp. coracana]